MFPTQTPKEKKSYTISSESVQFLEAYRVKLQVQSISAALEQIIQSARRQQEQAELDYAISKFYDSVPDKDIEEEGQWSSLGLQQLRIVKDNECSMETAPHYVEK